MRLASRSTSSRRSARSSATRTPGVEQGLDQHDVTGAAGLPHRLVVAADLVLGGDVGQRPGLPGDLDVEFGAQVPEHVLEVGVVGSLAAQVFDQLTGLAFRRGTGAGAARGVGGRSDVDAN